MFNVWFFKVLLFVVIFQNWYLYSLTHICRYNFKYLFELTFMKIRFHDVLDITLTCVGHNIDIVLCLLLHWKLQWHSYWKYGFEVLPCMLKWKNVVSNHKKGKLWLTWSNELVVDNKVMKLYKQKLTVRVFFCPLLIETLWWNCS